MFNDIMQILLGIGLMLFLFGMLCGIGLVALINRVVKDD
jgi:hypothetical protein